MTDWTKQLLDGRINLLQRAGKCQDILGSALEKRIPLKLRFRHDSTTIILHPLEEIGVLDKKMAAALNSLQEIARSIIIELFLDHEQEQDSYSRRGKRAGSIRPLQIQIYGPDEYYNEVGSALSSAGMYLQEPVFLDHGVVYRNPHFLSWDDSPETPLLNTAREDREAGFTAKIEAIMDSFKPVLQVSDVKQDARILTILRKYDIIKRPSLKQQLIRFSESHQLSALDFMLKREDEHQNNLSLWKPYNVNNQNG